MTDKRKSVVSGPECEPPVIVLGGGPAGLAAAWKLVEGGARVVVLEAARQVGGLAATQTFEGRDGTYRFDFGGHRFLTRDPELLAFIETLLGDDLLHAERASVIRYRGRVYDYPLSLGNLLTNAPFPLLVGAARDLLLRLIRPPRQAVADDQMSFRDWITARFGPTLYQHFFEGYTAKLWGIDPAHLSGDWAAQRISLIDLRDVARRLLPGRGPSPEPTPGTTGIPGWVSVRSSSACGSGSLKGDARWSPMPASRALRRQGGGSPASGSAVVAGMRSGPRVMWSVRCPCLTSPGCWAAPQP
ncbi:NAD(P)-binding protein [Hahella sp. SMD15-11]|uniref:NAD(P)-binding protein n=1 Tax=Thermohahella caldifontis TaxID=3142973 RepID=A0AB39USR8_9GAMM